MKTALIVIDVQKAIDHPQWGKRNNPDAEKNMAVLLHHWRKSKQPIIHIKHSSVTETSPYRAGQLLHNFKDEVKPLNTEKIIEKSTNNAFVGTCLENYLKENSIDSVVIVGVLTQHSVDCTARMAASLGFKVTVVSDATAATGITDAKGKHWDPEDIHQITLAHLEADYSKIVETKILI